MSYTLSNAVSSKPENCNIGYNNSWLKVNNNAGRELYSQASFITNFDDLSVSLSAADINIGTIHISDHDTGLKADVVPVGIGLAALRVITQDLESNEDDVTIGDRLGNFASVYAPLSALKVYNTNPISSVDITNIVTVKASNTFPISGSVTVLNPVTSVNVLNFPTQLSSVSITNQLTGITVLNPISSVNIKGETTITDPITALVILDEPVALKDLNNNNVTVNPLTSSLNVNVTNPVTSVNVLNFPTQLSSVSITNQLTGITVLNPVTQVTTLPQPTQLDAFGRLRISSPMTLFDSSHRYRDNNLWASLTAVGGTHSFNQNQGLIQMTVNSLSGSSVIRETTKVFSYQPGKSLLVMNTFVMASSANNLRQRVGYFDQDNGMYLQLDDGNLSIVERTLVNGSPSSETTVLKSAWNGDKLDGTGPSGLTLDITKAQILWMDIEWLGLGTVRVGFVINGQFIICHSFHHANILDSTYITTASLPLRYEITNKAATSGSKTLKQVCSTVISEGGYELRGLQQAVSTPILSPKSLATAGVFYPVISIRLKASPNRLDAIAILTALSVMGTGTGVYSWRVVASATTSGGGAWVDAGVDSCIEYKLDGTTTTGGRILASGFFNSNTQSSTVVDILKEALFKFQLERNGLTGTPYELSLIVTASTNTELVYASLDWEEISR
jgi:hypothetical protein